MDKYNCIKKSACQCRAHGFHPWFKKILPASEQLSSCTALLNPSAATAEHLQPALRTREATKMSPPTATKSS